MPDFSQLAKSEVDPDRTVDFQFDVIAGQPVLQVAIATEANTKFMNAKLKDRSKNKARLRQIEAGKMNTRHLAETRDEDRVMYAKYIVKGWRNVKDAKGGDVQFSEENCREFLAALPTWLFDELRAFCQNPVNFADIPDIEETAKN